MQNEIQKLIDKRTEKFRKNPIIQENRQNLQIYDFDIKILEYILYKNQIGILPGLSDINRNFTKTDYAITSLKLKKLKNRHKSFNIIYNYHTRLFIYDKISEKSTYLKNRWPDIKEWRIDPSGYCVGPAYESINDEWRSPNESNLEYKLNQQKQNPENPKNYNIKFEKSIKLNIKI